MTELLETPDHATAYPDGSLISNMPTSAPTVVLVDDSENVRRTMTSWLSRYGCEIVGEAADGIDAIDQVASLHPDFVVMGAETDAMDAMAATLEMKTLDPHITIVGFTRMPAPQLLAAGAVAWFSKDEYQELASFITGRAMFAAGF